MMRPVIPVRQKPFFAKRKILVSLFIASVIGTTMINTSKVLDLPNNRKMLIRPNTNLSCEPTLEKNGMIFIACFNTLCFVESDAVRFNSTCYKLTSDLTTFRIGDKIVSYIKPREDTSSCLRVLSHSWCTVLNNIKSLLVASILWIVGVLIRIPLLHIFRVLDKLSCYIIKGRRICDSCSKSYRFVHFECDVAAQHRTDYHIIYYVLLLVTIILLPSVSSLDDSKFNTYNHNDYTEFIVRDIEGHVDEIYYKQNHVRIGVVKSYFDYRLTYVHDILEKKSDLITSINYDCHNNVDNCYKGLKGIPETYGHIRKNHDGFSCLFTNAMICASCSPIVLHFAKVYESMTITPVIEISIEINNDIQKLVIIDNYEDYSDDMFYIRSLDVVEPEQHSIVVKDNNAYTGNICSAPSTTCFGSHIQKNGTNSFYYDPVYLDDNSWSSSIELRRCTINENLDLKQLRYIGKFFNNTVHENKNFGHYSIGVRTKMLLDDKICETEVNVKAVYAIGCYNCRYGFELEVEHSTHRSKICGKLICKTSTYKILTYVNGNKNVKIKMFSDFKTETVICNDKKFIIELTDDKIASHHTSGSYIAEATNDKLSDIKAAFTLISMDGVKMIVFGFIIVLILYCTLRFSLGLTEDIIKLRSIRAGKRKNSNLNHHVNHHVNHDYTKVAIFEIKSN
nr:glycoprotein [Ailanthus crinkle leaf associated emaravirus]